MRSSFWLVVLSSCLAAEGPPVPLQCTECASDEACDEDVGCSSRCDDEGAPCVDDSLVCVSRSCVDPCDESDCVLGRDCEFSTNRCYESCIFDGDIACRGGFSCCNDDRRRNGLCELAWECFR